jgi:hypothetical protein
MTKRFVVKNPEGGWDVKAPHAQRASAHKSSQAAAYERARDIVRNAGGGEVVVQGRDGRFRNPNTIPPARDPNPPKDRRH